MPPIGVPNGRSRISIPNLSRNRAPSTGESSVRSAPVSTKKEILNAWLLATGKSQSQVNVGTQNRVIILKISANHAMGVNTQFTSLVEMNLKYVFSIGTFLECRSDISSSSVFACADYFLSVDRHPLVWVQRLQFLVMLAEPEGHRRGRVPVRDRFVWFSAWLSLLPTQ